MRCRLAPQETAPGGTGKGRIRARPITNADNAAGWCTRVPPAIHASTRDAERWPNGYAGPPERRSSAAALALGPDQKPHGRGSAPRTCPRCSMPACGQELLASSMAGTFDALRANTALDQKLVPRDPASLAAQRAAGDARFSATVSATTSWPDGPHGRGSTTPTCRKLVYGYPIVWSKTSAVLTASIEEFVVTVDHQSLTDRRTSDAAIAGAPPRERPSLVSEGRTEMMRWLSP